MVDLLAVIAEAPSVEWTLADADIRNSVLMMTAIIVGVGVIMGGRDQWLKGVAIVLLATVAHIAFVLAFYTAPLLFDLTPEPRRERIQYDVAIIDEPEKPDEPEEPEEIEPEEVEEIEPEEPEVVPEVAPDKPPPKPKPKQNPDPQPKAQPDAAPPKQFDLSNIGGGNTGVVVQQGSGGEYGGQGKPDSKGKGKGKPAGDPKGDPQGTAAKWEPRSELYIKNMPKPVKVPKIACPATAELGVQGDVVLKVQVQADGKVRSVKVVTGIGQGCDKIAAKALRGARFKPAIGTNGKPVDFELRYEYAFRVKD